MRPENTDLDNLSKRLYEGDEYAFTEIFEQFWELLYFKAYSALRDKDESKDIVQKVFIDLWNRRKENLILNLKVYLLSAVKYQVFNYMRNGKITREHIDMFADILFYDHIDKLIDSNEINENLFNAVNELPEKCRNIFKLSRFESLSNREIAEKLEISVKTVENQITNAQKTLRTLLKNILK